MEQGLLEVWCEYARLNSHQVTEPQLETLQAYKSKVLKRFEMQNHKIDAQFFKTK